VPRPSPPVALDALRRAATPTPYTLHPKPWTLNPKLETPNPKT